ncbi:hypothetical protein [Pseudonocardia sp. HH130630-07]|uniref:hypothetical protein n=1 Tax=Pseudonocardia sp. HH130630-07 TaxID=1690815 RepID=UPI000814CEC2|nr:hypothetical protein [Pseudonocardia sp. HH130630-07]ANY10526.1 hypothetical protein AFB00_29365 [Pseudonocardia sp. HH130630-07]
MATPPRITDAERDAAIARIVARHAQIDDPRRGQLSDDAREVVSWVLGRGPVGVPRWVQAADHHDALILHTWCWWDDRRRERRLLRQGRSLGLTAAELGAPLGIGTRQGAQDRMDRLDALLAHDRPDEQLTRAARRAGRDRDQGQVWIAEHQEQIRAVLGDLLVQTRRVLAHELAEHQAPDDDRYEDDDADQVDGGAGEQWEDSEVADIADWSAELAADLDTGELSAASVAVAGLLTAEVRTHPRVLALDRESHADPVLAAMRRVDELRSALSAALVTGPSAGRTRSSAR